MGISFPVDFFAKVFITGDQNPVFVKCFSYDFVVIYTAYFFVYRENLVTQAPQPPRYDNSCILIY